MEIARQSGRATRRTKNRSSRKRARFASLAFETLEQRVLLAVDLVSVDMTGLVAGDDLPVPSVLDPSESGTHPDLSANGKYLVFESDAEDLRDNDGNELRDIFVRDLDSGVTTLISVTPDGISADADSYSADISDDGRFITFVSSATNLILGEVVDNGFPDVYLRDRDVDGNGVFDEPGELAARTFLLSRGFADEIPLPGAGAEEPGGERPVDYFLLAVADLDDLDEESTLVEDTAVFSGFYHPPAGPIFAHGTAGDDVITATTIDGVVTFAYSFDDGLFVESLFPLDDVTGFRARMHDGADVVTGSDFADLILGGPGSDSLFGEAGRDTMDGGPGNDRVFGGDGFDRLFDSEGDDLVDTGGPEPFGGTVNGVPGSDNIYVGAGQDTLNFDEALLAIVLDARNPNLQTVDADGNRVEATGFTHFIGTPFDDQFSIGGDVPLLFTFDGGLGSDTLTVDARGLPAINDGRRVQVMGFEPIEYTNFDRINIVNALPWVKASLEDHLAIDKNGNGKADPGDTLEYVVTIANDGVVDAHDLLFEDTVDANTELVARPIGISPIALDDIYMVRGLLSVNSTNGLLANDFDIDGSVPGTNAGLVVDVGSITRISDPTTSTFTAQPDGSFTYTPEPGFSGTETFTYSITDAEGLSNVGAVNLIINDVIWFIDNSLPNNGDGSLSNPFNSLDPVNRRDGLGDMDGPGDTIFVFGGAGVYNQSFELEDNQSLIGQGHGLFLGGRALVMPGPRPTLTNTTGDGIILASNNTVRGLNIDGAAGANIHTDGAQRGQFQDISLRGGTIGIELLNTDGTFTFTHVSISDPTGAVFNVADGTSKIAFSADSTIRQSTSTGSGLQFFNADGFYNFQGAVTLNGGDAGIDILGGSSGTFTFSDTTITDPSGAGLNVENSRPNITFDGITVRGGTNGIRFEGVTGDFTVIGNTVIDNTTGASISVGNSRGKFRFGDTDIGQTTPVDKGIDIENSSGTFFFDDLDVQTSGTEQLAMHLLGGQRPGAPQWVFYGGMTDVKFELTVTDTKPQFGPSGGVRASGGFIDGSPDDAISVSNGSLFIDGLTFGANQPIGGDAIRVTNASGTSHSVDVINSTINAPNGHGIVINNGVPTVPSFNFGFGGLTPVAGSFDGQPGSGIGQYDSASGSWFLRNAPNTGVPDVGSFLFGPGAIPIVGDWDGDGIDTIGIYDPNTQMFSLRNTNSAGPPDISPFAFGSAGDLPVAGDWDGDGIDSMGVFRPSDGSWYLLNSFGPGPADQIIQFGIAGDVPVAGDFDGDDKTDLGIFRPSNQTWYLRQSTASFSSLQFGDLDVVPVVGDWNGDGFDTVAVVNPSVAGGTTSQWTLRGSNSPVGSMKVNISGNQIVSHQAGIDVQGSGAGNTITTIANNTVQSNFNSIFAHVDGTGSANLELDLRDNRAGVYVVSNEGVGNAIKLVGELHTGQQLIDDDGGNVAARNNRLGNGVTLPTTNVNGLFVNGPIDIIAGLTQLPGGGSGEGAARNSHGNGLVGGEQHESSRFSAELGTLPAGKSVQVIFRATINDPLDAGVTQVANQGAISGSNVDMLLTDDPDTEALGDATSRCARYRCREHQFSRRGVRQLDRGTAGSTTLRTSLRDIAHIPSQQLDRLAKNA